MVPPEFKSSRTVMEADVKWTNSSVKSFIRLTRTTISNYSKTTWKNAKVIDRESDKAGRHIREAIWTRKTESMNGDGGATN